MGIIGVIVAMILILGGVVYAMMPHEMHLSYGIDFGLDHIMHIILGIAVVVIGFVVYWGAGKRKKAKMPVMPKIGK